MSVNPASGSLEVVALHALDAEQAQAGGADRLHVCVISAAESGADALDQALSLDPGSVSAIVRATDLPVRVTLRLSPGFTTQGGELSRLAGLVTDYLSVGVEGFVFGFLSRDLEVDAEVSAALAGSLVDAPWTFDRAFDHALDAAGAWRRLRGMPGLDGIHTAGSVLGMDSGLDDLMAMADADPAFGAVTVAAGGIRPEHVPWLVRCGVRRLHLGACVRPGGSWSKAHVDAGFVRSWRLLLDDAVRHSQGGVGAAV